jgi:citrate synthase
MTSKTNPIRSDIAWSTRDRIVVRGKSLPDEIIGHLNLGDFAFLQMTGRTPNTALSDSSGTFLKRPRSPLPARSGCEQRRRRAPT